MDEDKIKYIVKHGIYLYFASLLQENVKKADC